FLKRHYLRFFYEKIFVENKKISRIQPTPIFAILRENKGVILADNQLQDRKLNITSYLAQTFQIFENFKLMAELRQELDKLKNPMTLLPTTSMTNQLGNY
ncbi:hypothetical protein KKE19_04055, partial [Patescibacteria group bacterium]|nr:hypothetical protein [Patescibacteria group bacterium]